MHFMLYCFAQVTELLKSGKYFLHNEEVRLGFEHAVSIDELSEAYPLLDVIDHAKSRAAVCTLQGVLKILTMFLIFYNCQLVKICKREMRWDIMHAFVSSDF